MARDKAYGGIIFFISVLIILGYTYWVILVPLAPSLFPLGDTLYANLNYAWILPLWIGILGIFAIAAWIGWTMMTKPPPIPIEELEEELEEAEDKD